MLKSKSQSMQAPLALSRRNFLLLSNTNQLIWNNTGSTGVQTTLFKQTKQTKQIKRKLRRSKNNTTVHETIKMKCLEETWDFYWWRRGCLGHPQALTLVLLGYFLGWHAWHPQAWALVHPSSHYSFLPYTWNFSFIQNFTQSLLATLVYSKDIRPLEKL